MASVSTLPADPLGYTVPPFSNHGEKSGLLLDTYNKLCHSVELRIPVEDDTVFDVVAFVGAQEKQSISEREHFFSNGGTVNIDSICHTVTEHRSSKNKFDPSYQPSHRLFLLAVALSRKRVRHFIQDAVFTNRVLAMELNVSMSELFSFRGVANYGWPT